MCRCVALLSVSWTRLTFLGVTQVFISSSETSTTGLLTTGLDWTEWQLVWHKQVAEMEEEAVAEFERWLALSGIHRVL